MAVDLKFATAFIDGSERPDLSTYRILGVRLRKFCLWHRLLLKTLDSPLMSRGRVTMGDLRIFVAACSSEYGNSRLRKPWLVPTWIYIWAFILAIFCRRQPGEPTPLQDALSAVAAKTLEYAGEYLQDPEYAIIPPDTKNPKTPPGRGPEEIEHIAELIGWTHYPLKTLWEMPVGQANWLRMYALRATGADIDVISAEDKAFQASLPENYKIKKKKT